MFFQIKDFKLKTKILNYKRLYDFLFDVPQSTQIIFYSARIMALYLYVTNFQRNGC